METLRLFAAIMIAGVVGWNILALFTRKNNDFVLIESLFLSFGIGLGSISLEMLIFHQFRIRVNLLYMSAPWIALAASNVFISLASKAASSKVRLFEGGRLGPVGTFLGLGIMFECLYALFRALVKPIESYDAIAIYAIRSKIFYLAQGIPADFFTSITKLFAHPDYPLNIPLSESFIYLVMGNLNDQLVKLIFPLFYFGILAMLYFAVRRYASRTYALLFTFILATIPQFNAYAANAYHDLPLAFYYFASAICLFMWMQDTEKSGLFFLSALLAAISGWTKNEGLMYCIVNIMAISAFFIFEKSKLSRKTILNVLIYVLIIVAVSLPWAAAKRSAGIVNNEIDLINVNPVYVAKQLHKIVPITYELQKQIFGPKKWNILWPAALAIIAFGWRRAFSGPGRYMAMSVVLALLGYILFYMISYVDVVFFTSKTWSRFLIHFLPVLVLWLAFTLREDIKL